MKKIISVFFLGILMIIPFGIKAEEVVEDTTDEVIEDEIVDDTIENPTDEELVKSELAIWFDENVIPILLFALSAFIGSGAITFISKLFFKKVFDKLEQKFDGAANDMNLSKEQNEKFKETLNNFEEKMNEAVNDKLVKIQDACELLLKEQQLNEEQKANITKKIEAIIEKLEKELGEGNEES